MVGLFPNTGSGNGGAPYAYSGREYNNREHSLFNGDKPQAPSNFNDSGSASRFFYCAKASSAERNMGLEGMDKREASGSYEFRVDGSLDGKPTQPKANFHPTVKPISLMQYLCRLVTPPKGIALDPFTGSGSTLCGAVQENFRYIGIELSEEYCKIARKRVAAAVQQLGLGL